MNKRTIGFLMGSLLLTGSAFAANEEAVEPIALNESEMDSVTAGYYVSAYADASAFAYSPYGYSLAYVETYTHAYGGYHAHAGSYSFSYASY
ncbi:MAG: hypothetical protein AB1648_00835 [Pseudomonadota bacterium]